MSEELFRKLSLRSMKSIEKPRPLKMVPCLNDHEVSIYEDGKVILVLKGPDPSKISEAKEVLELYFAKKKENNTGSQENDSETCKSEKIASDINGNEINNVSPPADEECANNGLVCYSRETLLDLATSDLSLGFHKDWESVTNTCTIIIKNTVDVIDVDMHRQKFTEYVSNKELRAMRTPDRRNYGRYQKK